MITRRQILPILLGLPAFARAQEGAPDGRLSKGRSDAFSVSSLGTVDRDLAYGPLAANYLDLWKPSQVSGPLPVCVFFHGGGFGRGDKMGLEPRFRDALLARGFAVASANYRLRPQARFPAPMEDGVRAVQYLRARASDLNLDAKRFAVSGRSAGGAIALWIAYHNNLAQPGDSDPVKQQSTRVKAAAVVNAQTTFRLGDLQRLFGVSHAPGFFANLLGNSITDDEAERASPLANFTRDDPPAYLLYVARGRNRKIDPTRPDTYVHNRNFAEPVKELALQYGISVIVEEVRPRDLGKAYAAMGDFLAKATA